MVISLFGVRLVQLQGIDPQSYAAMAAREGMVTVELPADRGAITDRNGVELATSVDGRMIVADPTMTAPDAPEIASFLAEELDLDYFATLESLRYENTRFRYIARRVPSTIALDVLAEAQERGYRGLSTRRDPMRDYPARDVAANVVGFLGDDAIALGGLEKTFDGLLSGTDGEATYEVGGGNRIPLGDQTTVEPQDGADLELTIERDLQWFVQRVLRSTIRGAGGDSGAAVVMDSRTGELLAIADDPTFDANRPGAAPERNRVSRAASDVYEPGSVQKVLTTAALLDAGKVTPRTRIEVPGTLPRQDRVIHDHWDHGDIRLTMAGVLARSSNIGTVLAADEFSPDELHAYLRAFGLGQRTDVGIRNETAGLLPDPSLWSQINQDTIAFGQGVSVNAIQMAAAVNTIANGGERVAPSLVRGSATSDEGEQVGTATAERRQVVSPEAAAQTMQMMELVTDPEDGVAPGAAVPGYRVAGKTGTAQRVGEECGCYDGTYTVSFAGFAPADDPRFTVYVVVQNPRNGGGGGSVAGPAFSRIMSHLLRRYAVAPTGTQASTYPIEW
ncbi:penicillin-binding protein 2 [Nocardioides sp. MJB4]|uniref:Penicillin-binding protein 2 n=2 Tax=Nocardioides donggukensis TaxID=2774019 RepID=A0A927K575_9ACTN|nr:penicillin-binding protein 2 [Nocardioides donggukensis]